MKKITLLFSVVIFALAVTSCNKKKIKDLEAEAAANKAALEALQTTVANNSVATGTANPINVSFMGNRGFDSTAYAYSKSFAYLDGEADRYEYVYDYNDGSGMLQFYVEKYDAPDADYYSEIDVYDFDPAVGINSAKIYVYAESRFAQSDTAANLYVYQEGYLNNAYNNGYADNITINSFSYNESTRAYSINLTVNSTEVEPLNDSYNPAKITLSYSGILTHSIYNNGYNSTVYRKGNK
jgi:hypothetical protein